MVLKDIQNLLENEKQKLKAGSIQKKNITK